MFPLRFKEWPILAKIITISIISVTFITLIILLYFMPLIEQKMLDGKKEGLENVVDVAYGFFQEYDKQVTDGQMSLDEARSRFAQRIKNMRYDDNEYFWISDLQAVMVMHPIKPELDGKNLNDVRDPTGKYIFHEFVNVCESQGSGFVSYMWPKVEGEKPVPKIAYVRLYEPWGWIIGSGIYIGDLKSAVSRLQFYMLTGILIFTIVTISLAVTIGNGITRPLRKVITGLQDIASGKGQAALTKRIAITSIDEIGMLSKEFNSLMESINRLAVFKKIIEEEDSLDDVYLRLGEVFTQQLGISCCCIYQAIRDKKAMSLIYSSCPDQQEMLCTKNIFDNCDLCKAKRTGRLITSSVFPAICRQFTAQDGRCHYCLPFVVGAATVAVAQFVFDAPDDQTDVKTMEARVFKAEQYINESLPVIETKRLMNSLRETALIDPLTGLYNRRYLHEYAEMSVAGVLRRGKAIGLIMCDLDYFKQVNDTYGHNAGDTVLRETSHVIRQSIRKSDVLIRFGGEEFLVVLLDISDGESMQVAEKIRLNIEQLNITLPDGAIQKTISLGISEFPTDTGTLWSCIKYADVALYRAKAEGRNRCVRFTQDMWKDHQV